MGLVCSEAAEAMECIRRDQMMTTNCEGKLQGLPSELADIIIRVLDAAEVLGIDMEAEITRKLNHNKLRPYRHGGKSV